MRYNSEHLGAVQRKGSNGGIERQGNTKIEKWKLKQGESIFFYKEDRERSKIF